MAPAALPRTIMGYVLGLTARHQIGLALLSIAVFTLSTAPLELQRRIVNDVTEKGSMKAVLWLAIAYAAVALAEQVLKLVLNVYRGWVAESTVRSLRRRICDMPLDPDDASPSLNATGVEIALILEEAEPIGGFTAISISEPLLQGGVLATVVGYMIYLESSLALFGLAFFIPQVIFVPLLQQAINRRAQARILTKRQISGVIVEKGGIGESGAEESDAITRIFGLNMGIYRLKYAMNLLMNLMHHLAVAVTLCAGGWLVLEGRLEVGTVVAIVGGLGKLNDPWGDLVNWGREFSVADVKYRLFVDAAAWLSGTASQTIDPRSSGVLAQG